MGDALMSSSTDKILETYERDGFIFPIDIVGEAEAGELRADQAASCPWLL